jgi:hypothetical protein
MLANRDASPAGIADQQTAPQSRSAADAAYGCVDWYLYDAPSLSAAEATDAPGVSGTLAAAATTLLTGVMRKELRIHRPS